MGLHTVQGNLEPCQGLWLFLGCGCWPGGPIRRPVDPGPILRRSLFGGDLVDKQIAGLQLRMFRGGAVDFGQRSHCPAKWHPARARAGLGSVCEVPLGRVGE